MKINISPPAAKSSEDANNSNRKVIIDPVDRAQLAPTKPIINLRYVIHPPCYCYCA